MLFLCKTTSETNETKLRFLADGETYLKQQKMEKLPFFSDFTAAKTSEGIKVYCVEIIIITIKKNNL